MANLNFFKIQVSEVNSIEMFIGSKVTHPCQGLVTIICFEGSLSSKNMNRVAPIVFGSMTHFSGTIQPSPSRDMRITILVARIP